MPLSVEDEKVILGECYANQRIDAIYFDYESADFLHCDV
jgi:hypothetical protein